MSDVTPGLVPAPSPSVPAAPLPEPTQIPDVLNADAQEAQMLAATIPARAQYVTVTAPSPVPVSTPPGSAGLAQYVGDFAQSLDAILPAKARAILYPFGFLVSAVAVAAGVAGLIPLPDAALIAVTSQAFTNGLALGNVPKSK